MKSKRRRPKKSSIKRSAGFAARLVRALARAGAYLRGAFAPAKPRRRIANRRRTPARAAAPR